MLSRGLHLALRTNRAALVNCSLERVAPLFTSAEPQPVRDLEVKYTKLFINNEFVDSASGKTFQTLNPSNEEVLAEVAESGQADVDRAVGAAREAFRYGSPWRRMDATARGRILWRLADLIERDWDYLSTLETLDNGKAIVESHGIDLPLVTKCYRYYAGWAGKNQGKVVPIDGDFFQYTRHEPVGVVGQIIPWNFPLLMMAWKLAPALSNGCTVVIKPAEQTPLTCLHVAQLCKEAGLPPGVLNVLPGYGPTVGAPLAMHQDVDKVAFTGSTEVGKLILPMAAASNLKRVSLELGGKSPQIVCADADLDKAVNACFIGLFLNQGQCCIAGTRIFVDEQIHDKFVDRMIARVNQMVVGDPLDPKTTHGAQVDDEQLAKILRLINEGQKQGAKLCTGGARLGDRGYYVQPTVFTDVEDNNVVAKEEIFGPVMQIMKYKTLPEAVDRANNTKYGLGGSIYSQNIDTIMYLTQALRVGTLWVNCHNVFDSASPFGGYKESGHGRELGEYGNELYTEVKSVIYKIDQKNS